MNKLPILLAGLVLASGIASADTIVRLGKHYPDHTVSEGYAGDIDKLQTDVFERRNLARSANAPDASTPGNELRHPDHGYEITIADVRASVYSDYDRDGFFTQFSLNFDVDSYYGYEYVYAKIYLRTGDSDYELFHVTDVFEIYSNLSSDRYKVDSKLVTNFDAAYYDVRIEVLIAGRTGVQDEVDAANHRSLHALPLEAERLDGSGDTDIVVHEHSGAFSLSGLLVLALFGIIGGMRRMRAKRV